jgi:uncharacterized protein involved in exopolysaccharide biosynthesis
MKATLDPRAPGYEPTSRAVELGADEPLAATMPPYPPRQPLLAPEIAPTVAWRDRLVSATLEGMLRHRLFAMLLIGVCAGGAGVATLRMEPWYVATATIFPATESSPMGALGIPGIASLVGNLGGLGGGASQFPIYENVVHSERLIAGVLAMQLPETGRTLLDHLEIPEPNPELRIVAATDVVRENILYDTDKKTGLVSISYRDRDPEVAAAVTNRVLSLLNDFDISTSAELARERRRFVDARLAEARDSLQQVERRLEDFGAENLRIGRAPDLLLAQARLERELNIRQEVYLALRKEAEMARIEEQRTVPAISVLDRASVPAMPAGPSLVRNVALGTVLGIFLTVGVFALGAVWRLRLLRPAHATVGVRR